MAELKQLPLHTQHLQAGAKMAPFAGYEMPVRYSGDKAEHMAVREKAGLFDVSHMGEFFLDGPGALKTLEAITANNVSKLSPGKAQYSALLNEKAGIIDDLLIYQLGEQSYMAVVNAANIEKDRQWFEQHLGPNTHFEDRSDQTVLLALQGPKASDILQPLTGLNLGDIPFYTFAYDEFAGMKGQPEVLVSATGYTGSGGFELYANAAHAPALWEALMELGESEGLLPCGLSARDTLRLEMGLLLYGNDMTEANHPYEAGLGWITKRKKPNPSVATDALNELKEKGFDRKLVGFVLEDRGVPRHGYALEDENGKKIGTVTSGSISPMLNKGVGLGYVEKAFAEPGTALYVKARNKSLAAKVQKPPFVEL